MNTPTTWAHVSPKTILSAMEFVTTIDPDFHSEGHLNTRRKVAIHYIAERLHLTDEQAGIVTGACFLSATHSRGFDCDDLCSFLSLHPFQALQMHSRLDELDQLGYLMLHPACPENYCLTPQAMEAIQEDRPFDANSLRVADNIEFLREVNARVRGGQRNDRDHRITPAVERLFRINDHLTLVQNLRKQPNPKDRWLLLLMMITLAAEGDAYVNPRDLEMVLPGPDVRMLITALQHNQHPYVQNGWILPYGQDGMAQATQWVLSPECWRAFLKNDDEVASVVDDNEMPTGNLISWKELEAKHLFFSGKTREEVDRLRKVLDDSSFRRIREELAKRKMPQGFCCLLYGVPGTGKTELVHQLAIETQRDIMQVDIAGLRDKYVGETEKAVQHIFDSYRKAVQMAERAPILFFNEADAIFGNRMERTTQSVDKMENAMQNIILQEMETLDGILICTTNLTSTLDKAFDRRFLYKIEFKNPDSEVRQQIWKTMLDTLTDEQAHDLADRFCFTGGQILNISRKQVINAIFTGNQKLDYERILSDCREETISRNNGRSVGF